MGTDNSGILWTEDRCFLQRQQRRRLKEEEGEEEGEGQKTEAGGHVS
jgi:hypothetical protein